MTRETETNRASTDGLRLEHITFDVRDGERERRLLDDVSLTIDPGEVVAVMGPSGSGKSTLLAIAGCLQRPTSGTVTLPGGTVATGLTRKEASAVRRNDIGIVFQQPNLHQALTVRQQLISMTRMEGVWRPGRKRREAAAERADHLLASVGLADLADRYPSEISGGQQARVNLARALMNRPAVLLADEPTAALDREAAATVTDLIAQVTHEEGTSTMYVTHDETQAGRADRIVRMVDGHLRATETVSY